LSIDQIERIEILKGGHSTLYGSDAVAGVVNIISRKTHTGKPSINASLASGSFNTVRSTAGISGTSSKLDYLLQLSSINAGGFSAAADTIGDKGFDKDNYQQQTARAQVGYKTGTHSKLITGLLYSRYKTELDAGAFQDEQDFVSTNTNQQFNLGWLRRGTKTNFSIQYQYNEVERDYLDDSLYSSNTFIRFAKSNYIGRSHFADLYASTKVQNWELLAGADFRHHSTVQNYFSIGSWGPYTVPTLRVYMAQLSTYGSAIYKKNNFTTELGGRFNYHSEYGNNATFTINPAYRLNKAVRIFGNLYTAFKTPTLYQLFDPYSGNDSLLPEKGFIQELGIDFMQGKKFSGRVVAFNRKSKETILYTYDLTTFAGQYLNASSQTNYGFETELQWSFQPVSFRANYAFTNGTTKSRFDGTGAAIGKDTSYYNLYRIPKHAFNWLASYQIANWIFNLSGRVASAREEFVYGAAPLTMQGYATFDLYTEHKFEKVKGLRAFLDIRNFTNTKYEEIRGYTTRGFNFMTGLLYSR
jgi:vitamin B12 transporter